MSVPKSLQTTHIKLLGFDLQSLTPTSDPNTFCRLGTLLLSRVELVGTVTSRDSKPNKFLKFTLDDGTASLTCVLWLNQLTSPYFSRRNPSTLRLIANLAADSARHIKIGTVVRVRGWITNYRNQLQISVTDAVVEKDPNVELLHWLDCLRLARKCYRHHPVVSE